MQARSSYLLASVSLLAPTFQNNLILAAATECRRGTKGYPQPSPRILDNTPLLAASPHRALRCYCRPPPPLVALQLTSPVGGCLEGGRMALFTPDVTAGSYTAAPPHSLLSVTEPLPNSSLPHRAENLDSPLSFKNDWALTARRL